MLSEQWQKIGGCEDTEKGKYEYDEAKVRKGRERGGR
jgi:hypothetical protein